MANDDDLFDDTPYDDEPEPAGPSVTGVVVPFFVAGAAALVGLLVGAVAMWVLTPTPDPVIKEVPRNYTDAELQIACSPFTEEAETELEEAVTRVTSLESRVSAKEQEVADLQEEMARRGKRGAELVRKLEEAQKELVSLEKRLERAVEEKEQLQQELDITKVELKEQKVQTKVAKEDALDFKWRDFTGSTKLNVCDRGWRKKVENCRETVEAALGPALKAKFGHCVRSGQAVPGIRELEKDQTLPQFAEFIDEEERVLKGWYVMLCDPTLPEAAGSMTASRPPSAPATGGAGDDLDLDDLDLE